MKNLFAVLASFWLIAVVTPASAENRDGVAVIIGNAVYQHERVPNVDYAHRDADAFRRYVTDVLGFRDGNIIDLRDATKAEMESAFGVKDNEKGLIWQFRRKDRSDVVVFYSGHGVPGSQDGRGYLLPSNANPLTAELNGYPIDVLYENLAKLEARSVTVFLDACFTGDSPGGMLIESASPVFVQAALSEPQPGMTVITAASDAQLASWDEDRRHGLFTGFLLDGLYGRADADGYGDGDGQVTLDELKVWLDEEMSYAAQRRYRRVQQATVRGDGGTVLATITAGRDWMLDTATPSDPPPPAFSVDTVDTVLFALKRTNVRSGPGTGYDRVGQLNIGDRVTVTGRVDSGDWLRILLDGQEAYVFAELFSDVAPTVSEAPAPPKKASAARTAIQAGTIFRDCVRCPEMIVVPGGGFVMGSPADDPARDSDEGPSQWVEVAPFAIGVYEVTVAEYETFHYRTGRSLPSACWSSEGGAWQEFSGRNWLNPGFRQSPTHPVVCVSWEDAKAFVDELSERTGKAYRLLSEAEWEYAARAGSGSRFPHGDDLGYAGLCEFANGAGGETGFAWKNPGCADRYRWTAQAGSYPPNAFGIHDMIGNANEWVEDCWRPTYAAAQGDCAQRTIRGGGWDNAPNLLRSANRYSNQPKVYSNNFGFRVARDLN